VYPRSIARGALRALTASLLALILALSLSRILASKTNDYAPSLTYSRAYVTAHANCIAEDYPVYVVEFFCSIHAPPSLTTYSYRSDGLLSSVGFWRISGTQLGDVVAWYGIWDTEVHTRYWNSYTWRLDDMRITVSTRYDNLFARVQFVIFSWR